MNRLLESPTWCAALDDFAKAIPDDIMPLGRILVTGASGLIGSALVDLLLAVRRVRRLQFVVVAAGRSSWRLQQRFGAADGLEFLEYDATKPFAAKTPFSVIIHAASNAAPAIYMKNPCDTLTVNITGVRDLLECARQNQGCRVLYVSSGEVNGVRLHAGSVNEDDYGRVDPLDLRMVYSEAKRAAESLCAAYVAQYGVRVVIARPCHVYGPTALASDPRVAADFAYKAARGENIVLKSAGTQLRTHCHCLDCATALLTILARGESAKAYNIANPESTRTVRELALMLAEAGGVSVLSDAPTAVEQSAFSPLLDATLDSTRLLDLGWRGTVDIRDGLFQTVRVLREVL